MPADTIPDERLLEIVDDDYFPKRETGFGLWNGGRDITRREVVALARELLALRAHTGALSDSDVEPLARFMALNIGHGMTEKTIGFAKLAVEYSTTYRAPSPGDDRPTREGELKQ